MLFSRRPPGMMCLTEMLIGRLEIFPILYLLQSVRFAIFAV